MTQLKRAASELDVLANLRSWAPEPLLEFLDQILLLFPEDLKYRLKQVIDVIPSEGDHMHKVLEVVRSQWKDLTSEGLVRIAVVGPPQTGKTALIRALAGSQAQEKHIFTIVEPQGLEEYLGYGTEKNLPQEVGEADLLLLVLDARFGVSEATLQMLEQLRELQKPVLVVLNKMDLAENPREVLQQAKGKLGTNVLGTSVRDGSSLGQLLKAMIAVSPRTVYALSQESPELRRKACQGVVTQASLSSAVVAAIPIPVSDMLPLTAIQTAMLLKIARAFGFRLNRERARELIPLLLAGGALRQATHQLRRRFPVQANLIGVLVAALGTLLIGRTATLYFERICQPLERGVQPAFLPREAAS